MGLSYIQMLIHIASQRQRDDFTLGLLLIMSSVQCEADAIVAVTIISVVRMETDSGEEVLKESDVFVDY